METLKRDESTVVETTGGWMVTGHSYPRITVMAGTRTEALEAFNKAREEWLNTEGDA